MNINTKLNKLGLLMIEKYFRIRIGNEIGTWLGTGNWTGFGDIIGTEIRIAIITEIEIGTGRWIWI